MAKAREAGVDESTIQEAIRIANMIRQGASAKFEKDAASFLAVPVHSE